MNWLRTLIGWLQWRLNPRRAIADRDNLLRLYGVHNSALKTNEEKDRLYREYYFDFQVVDARIARLITRRWLQVAAQRSVLTPVRDDEAAWHTIDKVGERWLTAIGIARVREGLRKERRECR